jgi:hypothetical protein
MAFNVHCDLTCSSGSRKGQINAIFFWAFFCQKAKSVHETDTTGRIENRLLVTPEHHLEFKVWKPSNPQNTSTWKPTVDRWFPIRRIFRASIPHFEHFSRSLWYCSFMSVPRSSAISQASSLATEVVVDAI